MKSYIILQIALGCFCIQSMAASSRAGERGLLLDLDVSRGVTLEDGNRVSKWVNQAPGATHLEFVKRDEGRKEPGSGRPTLRSHGKELNGHPAIDFRQQELICMDEDAFDALTQGGGCTWIAVLCVHEQRVGLKDVNSFFGNLRNNGNFEGLWANLTDDNRVWWGTRNGITFGRFDENNPQLTGAKLEVGKFGFAAGRMAAGTGKVKLELFVNGLAPVSLEAPVNSKSNASKMAIGQERDATNHPGQESFDGELARLLIFSKPLDDATLAKAVAELTGRYKL